MWFFRPCLHVYFICGGIGKEKIRSSVFVRNLSDLELDVIECFLSKLQGHSVKRKHENRIIWKGDNEGVISVRRLYSLLGIDGKFHFRLKIVWNSWNPSKVSFFTWEGC